MLYGHWDSSPIRMILSVCRSASRTTSNLKADPQANGLGGAMALNFKLQVTNVIAPLNFRHCFPKRHIMKEKKKLYVFILGFIRYIYSSIDWRLLFKEIEIIVLHLASSHV